MTVGPTERITELFISHYIHYIHKVHVLVTHRAAATTEDIIMFLVWTTWPID